MTRSVRMVVRVVMVVLIALATQVPAQRALADDPERLDDQITDRVDALGTREAEVSTALNALRSQSGLQLFVVYVRSFDGTPAQEWADRTAELSDFGRDDAVLAVATGDRSYAYSFDADFPLTDDQLAEVATIAIEPPLASNDWAGAAVGAADGYGAALAGRPIPPPRIQPGDPDPDSDGTPALGWLALAGCLLIVLVAVGLVGWLVLRSRRRRAPAIVAPVGRPADPLAGLTDDELSHRANTLLVDADDAIKSSEEELGFAVAQYGAEATASFSATLASAKQDIARAFQLRQQLDDDIPEDQQTRRAMLAEIIRRCEAADQRLDAEADAFDALRDLEGRIEESIAEVTTDRDRHAARIPAAQSTLDTLRAAYADSALQSVSDNVNQAEERIQFTSDALTRAATDAQRGDRSTAAVAVRGAHEAVAQAGTLLDAVQKLSADLTGVGDTVQAALADIEADIAAGRAVTGTPGADTADLAAAVARAEQVTTAVRAQLSAPRPDPVAALRRLEEAGTGLDRALATVRDAAQRAERARSALDQAITRARAEISALTDFIATRRGAVGGEARTRLAEAQRHLDRALALSVSDPVAALAEAQRADALAEQAGHAARSDMDRWARPGGDPYGSGGVAGAVLGGILLGGVLGGGGGGFGGWGGMSPGGFGGSGSRSRRGGGGRF